MLETSLRLTIKALLAVFVSAVLLQAAGCGYQIRADGRPVGIRVESLAIPLVTSTSSNIAFESDFTRMLREEFISHARVPIRSREEAHMILVGHVRDIESDSLTFELDQRQVHGEAVTYAQTDSRRLTVVLEAKLIDRSTGETVWQDEELRDEARFEVSVDPLTTRYSQRQALRKIAARLAKRVYMKSMERF
ncbi:MAG: LPS assembly lipoprotein LptE [Desulfobacteraceae bacterium]|jgi:hypothetical protein